MNLVTTLYKVSYKKKPKSKLKTEYFDTFALALSRVSALRADNAHEILMSDMVVSDMKILVHYTLEDTITRAINVLGIEEKVITMEVLASAYRQKMKQAHPDMGGSSEYSVQVAQAKEHLASVIMTSGNIINERK